MTRFSAAPLALAAAAGAVALSGCGGDGEGRTEDGSPVDASGGGSSAAGEEAD